MLRLFVAEPADDDRIGRKRIRLRGGGEGQRSDECRSGQKSKIRANLQAFHTLPEFYMESLPAPRSFWPVGASSKSPSGNRSQVPVANPPMQGETAPQLAPPC